MRKAGEPFLIVQVHYVGYRPRWLVWYLENGPRLRLGPFSRYQTATSDDILYIRFIGSRWWLRENSTAEEGKWKRLCISIAWREEEARWTKTVAATKQNLARLSSIDQREEEEQEQEQRRKTCVDSDEVYSFFIFLFFYFKWRLFIFISRESKWGTLQSAGNPRCAVPAEIHSICSDRPRPGPAAGLQVSPTSDTSQSVAILMNRPHFVLLL